MGELKDEAVWCGVNLDAPAIPPELLEPTVFDGLLKRSRYILELESGFCIPRMQQKRIRFRRPRVFA